jgi:hypothetical protein
MTRHLPWVDTLPSCMLDFSVEECGGVVMSERWCFVCIIMYFLFQSSNLTYRGVCSVVCMYVCHRPSTVLLPPLTKSESPLIHIHCIHTHTHTLQSNHHHRYPACALSPWAKRVRSCSRRSRSPPTVSTIPPLYNLLKQGVLISIDRCTPIHSTHSLTPDPMDGCMYDYDTRLHPKQSPGMRFRGWRNGSWSSIATNRDR